jgi:exfoliative toxin A/B
MKNLINYPSPIGGLSLGIASIGIAWALIFPSMHFWALNISGAIAILLIIPLLLKFIFNPHIIWDDLASPYRGSLFPSLAMAVMIIGYDLLKINYFVGYTVWLLGLFAHLLLTGFFVYFMTKNFRFESILPSWFIPPVGIIVACVTMPAAHWQLPLQYLFYIGLAAFVILLPCVLFRLILKDKLHDEILPSLCILAAPANLCLIGYLSIFSNPDLFLIVFLFSGGCIMTLLIYIALPILLRLPFTPGFSSFTFPPILSAVASFKFALYIKTVPLLAKHYMWLHTIAYLELLIATSLVLFVIFHYYRHFLHPIILAKLR